MEYCPYCGTKIVAEGYFCQNCGKKLKEISPSGSVTKQIKIYLISFFIPPLGLFKGYPYLKQKNPKLRIIGIVAVMLTIASIVIVIWLAVQTVNSVNQGMKSLENLNFY
jgi:uncharacterized membrane protein YvbJ